MENKPHANIEVYINGCKTDGCPGIIVCIFQNNISEYNFCYELKSYSIVFQIELVAIKLTSDWALENKYNINIYSDSLSFINTISRSHPRSELVNSIKK